MDDSEKAKKLFTVDFRVLERRFKAMEAAHGDITGMRDLLNIDAQRDAAIVNAFIDKRVKAKHQDNLRIYLSKLITSIVSLGIAEYKLAAKNVRQEDLVQGKRAKGNRARVISLEVKEANPDLTPDQLRPLIDDARAKADPRLGAIKTSTLYSHLSARAPKN